jgi:hypothetical protein
VGILRKAAESPAGAQALEKIGAANIGFSNHLGSPNMGTPHIAAEGLGLLKPLVLPEELAIVQRLLTFPEVVAGAAAALEPHRVVFYLQETIAQFHGYYTKYKKTERVVGDDIDKSAARLFLVMQVKQVLFNALTLLGVSAPERMDSDEREDSGEREEA